MAANQRRMPQNAVGGGIQAGIRPEQLDALRNSLASSVGKTYQSGSPRGESAGYTTSSPGWRQPAPPPQIFPPAPAMPMAHPAAAMPHPMAAPDRGPQTTGAIGGGGGPTPEMIANATTTPSALFQPFNGPVPANATTSPSALFQDIPYSQLPGAHGQPPAPQTIFNPASMGQPPAPQGVVDLPAYGSPPAPQNTVFPPPAPPAPQQGPGPSSARPPRVIHPDNPTTGKLRPGRDRATVPKRPKKGGQYSLRQQGDRRS